MSLAKQYLQNLLAKKSYERGIEDAIERASGGKIRKYNAEVEGIQNKFSLDI